MDAQRIAEAVARCSLEKLVTDGKFLGLDATLHQRMVCGVAEGGPVPALEPITGYPEEVCARSGTGYVVGDVDAVERARELYVVCGIRTFKSLMAACLAIRAAVTCDLSGLQPYEMARVSVLSLKMDLAMQLRRHVAGIIESSPVLQQIAEGDVTDGVRLVHPSGRRVEIRVVAGAATGSSVVSTWSAGVIVDEAPRYAGSEDAKVNFDDLRAASLGRLVPGAQFVAIGSPWAAYGPVYDTVQEHWRRPSRDVCVVRCCAPALHPGWWTPQRVRDLEGANPVSYKADVLGEFVELETDALPASDVERARGDYRSLGARPRHHHIAAMDPGMRRNAWTLIIGRRTDDHWLEVCTARQWIAPASGSIDPEATMLDVAKLLQSYGIKTIYSDQYHAATLGVLARQQGIRLVDLTLRRDDKVNLISELATQLSLGKIRLPDSHALVDDLKRVRRVPNPSGGLRIVLPETADGRHCDYVPSLMLVARHLRDPEPERAADYDPGYEALVRKHRRLGLVS